MRVFALAHGGATMFGALAALGNAGGIFMPWVVGWVADQRNLHWGLAVSALAPAVMLPVVLALQRRRMTPDSPAAPSGAVDLCSAAGPR